VYTGVVRKADTPQSVTYTIELVGSEKEAKNRFNEAVAKKQSDGFTCRADELAQVDRSKANEGWAGSLGDQYQEGCYIRYDYGRGVDSWIVIVSEWEVPKERKVNTSKPSTTSDYPS